MFLRIVSYTLIVTLTTSLIAPPVWASAAIMRHYAGRMDDYNTDYKRASIGEATTEINRIFERAPSKKKANAEQKEQIFRTAMQTSTIHGTNAFLHGQTQTDANYYLSEKVQASNHHRILYGISALSYTYADILRSVSDEDLINTYAQFEAPKDALKSLLTSRKGRASFDGYTKISGISGSRFDDWFIDEFLKVNQGIQKDSMRYWWQPTRKISVVQTVPAKSTLKSAAPVAPKKTISRAGGGITGSMNQPPLGDTRKVAQKLSAAASAAAAYDDVDDALSAARHGIIFAERAFDPLAMPTLVQNNFIRAIDMMPKMALMQIEWVDVDYVSLNSTFQ